MSDPYLPDGCSLPVERECSAAEYAAPLVEHCLREVCKQLSGAIELSASVDWTCEDQDDRGEMYVVMYINYLPPVYSIAALASELERFAAELRKEK